MPRSSTRCNKVVQGVRKSDTRCAKDWYEVCKGLIRGVIGFVTRCDRGCYKGGQVLVLGDRVGYKVLKSLVQGVTKSDTRTKKVWYKV